MITLASLNSISAQKNIWSAVLDIMDERHSEHRGLINLARKELELINPSAFPVGTLESVPVVFFPFYGESTEKVCLFYMRALAVAIGCAYTYRYGQSLGEIDLKAPLLIDGFSPVVAVDIKSLLESASSGGQDSKQNLGLEAIASLMISRDFFYAVFHEHGLRLPGVRIDSRVLRLWLLRGNLVFYFSS